MCGSLLMFTIAGSMFIFSFFVNIFILIKKNTLEQHVIWHELSYGWVTTSYFFDTGSDSTVHTRGAAFHWLGQRWRFGNWTEQLNLLFIPPVWKHRLAIVYALAGDFRSFGRTPVPGYISLAGDRCACWHGKYILCLIFLEKPPVITLLYCSL